MATGATLACLTSHGLEKVADAAMNRGKPKAYASNGSRKAALMQTPFGG